MFREDVLKEGCTVECESEYQIKNLFKWLASKGYIWSTGGPLLEFIPNSIERVYIYIYIYKEVRYAYYTTGKYYEYNEIIKKPEPKDTTIDFMLNYLPDVKKIIHSDPDTVLIFKDGSTSTVERQQKHDLEKAILYAWVKKHKKKISNNYYATVSGYRWISPWTS